MSEQVKEILREFLERVPAAHPGEALRSILYVVELSENAIAEALKIPANRLNRIVNGRYRISIDTSARLARYFETDLASWLRLQLNYDLQKAETDVVPRIATQVQKRET